MDSSNIVYIPSYIHSQQQATNYWTIYYQASFSASSSVQQFIALLYYDMSSRVPIAVTANPVPPSGSKSLSSQLSSVLDLISTESEPNNSIQNPSRKSSARELLDAKKAQRKHADALNSLFIPFDASKAETQGGLHLYREIAESNIDPPTYWKGSTKKAKDKKIGGGVAYKDKYEAKASRSRGRQSRLNEMKKMY